MKIHFTKQILPHLVAVAIFYIVTLLFYAPGITGDKVLSQSDIDQWKGASRELREYRENTGTEPLWVDAMFSGMPAYLVNLEWDDQILTYIKIAGSLFMPHPYRNIFLAMLCFYVMLLVFRINPWISVPFALAFGIGSYLIIGTMVGHNARIGAIAFMPLVIAGLHYCLHYRYKLGGLALATLGISLHLRENHLQITYYIIFIVLFYLLSILISAFRENRIKELIPGIGILALAGIIGLGTFSGKFWSTYEYSKYSIRGKSELVSNLPQGQSDKGLSKDYVFEYSNGIIEPIVMVVPNFYGGSSRDILVADRESATFKVLSRAENPEIANQLARYSVAYWGPQSSTMPYYAGAIAFLCAIIGVFLAPKRYVYWLIAVALFGIIISWGDSAKWINYFLFDHMPGFSKFRSVTFAMLLPLFAIPFLGALGVNYFIENRKDKNAGKRFLTAAGIALGLPLILLIFSGMFSYLRPGEEQLPLWFMEALQEDRASLLRGDALRSLAFMFVAGILLYLYSKNIIGNTLFFGLFILFSFLDSYIISKRYMSEEQFIRPSSAGIAMTEADKAILQDQGEYRVYNIMGNAFAEARTSAFHQSVGGYHGAKLRRYQEYYESCLKPQTDQIFERYQSGNRDISDLTAIHMLNIGYLTYGNTAREVLPNPNAFGAVWFAENVINVVSADEEIEKTCQIKGKKEVVVNTTKSGSLPENFESTGNIDLLEKSPGHLVYRSSANGERMAVFSEIYYPVGWKVGIDGKEAEMFPVNYILRGMIIPEGEHEITFDFKPASYVTGNVIMLISCIILALLLLSSVAIYVRNESKSST